MRLSRRHCLKPRSKAHGKPSKAARKSARQLRFPKKIAAEKLRLRITKASGPPSIHLFTVSDSSTRKEFDLSLEADAATVKAALPDKNASIVTYCGSEKCPMSDMMAKKLQGLGYTKVSEFKAGIAGWKAAGGSVIK